MWYRGDFVTAMASRERAFYGDVVLSELQAQGVTYTPLIISC